MALCLLSICGPVTKHGPLFSCLSAWEARGAFLCDQHSGSMTAVMRSWMCRPGAILNTEIRRIRPHLWRSWMYLETIYGVNLVRLAVCPDSHIPPVVPFFPLSLYVSQFSIHYLYVFFAFLYCLLFYLSSVLCMVMSVLNLHTLTGPHLPFALVKITVLCWYTSFSSNSWLPSN
jgi:hypothetical protein